MAPPVELCEFAPAKVNLALHVTGRRADGYHILDSLVCFPSVGDCLTAEPAEALSLCLEGPFADLLSDAPDNLVLRAAKLLEEERGACLRLYKTLPVAAGIGGGSADAAAALRLLARLWSVALPEPSSLVGLGADVPVCLGSRAARMGGIGEQLTFVSLPQFWLVLVNPRRAVPTSTVFARLTCRDNPPLADLPAFRDAKTLAAWLLTTRNDLQDAACEVEPVINNVLAALSAAPGCCLVRMSGSGATCFGLFATEAAAEAAAGAISRAEPGWWVVAAPSLGNAPAFEKTV